MSRNASDNSRQTPRNSERELATRESNADVWKMEEIEHEPWCDPQQHARAIAEAHPDEGHRECVGRDVDIDVDGGEKKLYGIWMQDPGTLDEPYFYLEWGPSHIRASVEDLKVLQDLLLHLGEKGAANLTTAVTQAIGDYEQGVPTS